MTVVIVRQATVLLHRALDPRPGVVADLPNISENKTGLDKMSRQRDISQMKDEDKTIAKELNETEITNVPDK